MFTFIKKSSSLLYRQPFIRYSFFGGVASVIDMGILFILTDGLGIWYFFSAMIAYGFGMITAFTLNRSFNFVDKKQNTYSAQFLKYSSIALLGLALNQGILWFLVEHVHVYYLAAKIVSIVVVSIASYLSHRAYTFAK